jgi:catechol 2,3-dioxygenase-like lactoylglutathione lyase family enzyme
MGHQREEADCDFPVVNQEGKKEGFTSMGLRAIDHIIIGVHDLEQATATFEQQLGLLASGGGVHPFGGTANRIIVLGDTYLELITIHAPEDAPPGTLKRFRDGDGYMNFVLASDDIEAESQTISARGVSVIGPTEGSLQSADGRVRSWKRLDIERAELAQHYPFIIQHDSVGEERRFRLAGWQNPPEHPLGVTGVLSATIAVQDLAEAAQRFQRVYGIQPSQPFAGENSDGWDALLVAFVLSDGSQRFELAAPHAQESGTGHSLPEAGALTQHLQRHGESLCRITLLVKDLTASCRYLDGQDVKYTYCNTIHPSAWIRPEHACGAAIVLREF